MPGLGYRDSRLWMNKCLSSLDKWDEVEIEKRFLSIKERFLKIWQYPNIRIELDQDEEVNIFDADDPKGRKLEYAVFFDQKIEVNQISKLYVEVFKKLFQLQPETIFASDLGERVSLTKKTMEQGLRQAVAINDTYFIEANFDSQGKFNKIKYALTIFKLEDELSIKYSN